MNVPLVLSCRVLLVLYCNTVCTVATVFDCPIDVSVDTAIVNFIVLSFLDHAVMMMMTGLNIDVGAGLRLVHRHQEVQQPLYFYKNLII